MLSIILQGLRALWSLVRGYRLRMACVLTVTFIAGLTEFVGLSLLLPVIALAIGEPVGIDGPLGRQFQELSASSWGLTVAAAVMAAVMLMKGVFTILLVYLQTRLSTDLRMRWADQIFSSALHAPLASLSTNRVGEWVESVSSETQKAGNAVGTLLEITQRLMLAGILVVGLLLANWMLTLSILAVTFIILGILRVFGLFQSIERGKKLVEYSRGVANISAETMANIRQIKVLDAYARVTGDLREMLLKFSRTRVSFEVANQYPPMAIEVGLTLFILGGLVVYHQIDPDQLRSSLPFLVMFVAMGQRLVRAIGGVSSLLMKLNVGLANIQYVHSRITEQVSQEQLDVGKPIPSNVGSIRLQDVSFAWPGSDNVLLGVNMEFRHGLITAITGTSGSGKSTIAAMLTGLLQPDTGSVLIDDAPLSQYSLRSIRRGAGYVTQEVELFYGSIAENIRMGRPDATDVMVRVAARLAHADTFIEMTQNGYDTLVGERGATLSGGQRQRISLARVLLGPRFIYIFDEATSALDEETQQFINEMMCDLAKNSIVVLIAHRPSALAVANIIYQVEGGMVIQSSP